MNTSKKIKPPLNLIILDGIGSILLGLGLAEWIAETNLVPTALQFENYPIFMIVIGILLILPFTLFFIRSVRNKQIREI